jgi:hypothetical protein
VRDRDKERGRERDREREEGQRDRGREKEPAGRQVRAAAPGRQVAAGRQRSGPCAHVRRRARAGAHARGLPLTCLNHVYDMK